MHAGWVRILFNNTKNNYYFYINILAFSDICHIV